MAMHVSLYLGPGLTPDNAITYCRQSARYSLGAKQVQITSWLVLSRLVAQFQQ